MTFPDHFSDHADRYQAYRPSYPEALFRYIASLTSAHELAFDCATGNGQAARGLTPHFRSIVAIDASHQQLVLAPPHHQVVYVMALAHRTPLPDCSVDLVTVASAFHWLDFSRFYAEVRRVAKPGAVLAGWGYKRPDVAPDVDAAIERLDRQVLRRFWLPETRLAADGYQAMPFPFDEIDAPPFRMTQEWDLGQFVGFLGTWSASIRYLDRTGQDPLDEIRDELMAAWGDRHQRREVAFNLHLRIGRIR